MKKESSMNGINKANLLIIADDELNYGIEHGYYPEITQLVKKGDCELCSLEEYNHGKVNLVLKQRPQGNAKDVYIKNPYTNVYENIYCPQDDVRFSFVSDKSFAMKEAFVRLGAKRIFVSEGTMHSVHTKNSAYVEGSYEGVTGRITTTWGSGHSETVKKSLEYSNPYNQPRSWNEAFDYIKNHGLIGEASLVLLCERLRDCGRLSGKERMGVSFLDEYSNSFGLAVGVEAFGFGGEVGYDTETITGYQFETIVEIEF